MTPTGLWSASQCHGLKDVFSHRWYISAEVLSPGSIVTHHRRERRIGHAPLHGCVFHRHVLIENLGLHREIEACAPLRRLPRKFAP